MSTKRQATTELNHDNWDQEDSNESEGTEGFKMAPKEVLEKRVIRTAKRRSSAANSEGQKSVFSGFGGFNKTQKSSFNFLANLTNGNKTTEPSSQENSSMFSTKSSPTQNSVLFTSPDVSKPMPSLFEKPIFSSQSSTAKAPVTETKMDTKATDSPFKIQTTSPISSFNFTAKSNSDSSSSTQGPKNVFGEQAQNIFSKSSFQTPPNPSTSFSISPKSDKPVEKTQPTEKKESDGDKNKIDERKLKYYSNIKGLNISLFEWIKKHIDKSPVCIFTPVFKDYERHLKAIQDEYDKGQEPKPNGEKGDFNESKTKPEPTTTVSVFALQNNSSKSNSNEEKKTGNSAFGVSTTNTDSNKNSGFIFGAITKSQSPATDMTTMENPKGLFGNASTTNITKTMESPKGIFGNASTSNITNTTASPKGLFGNASTGTAFILPTNTANAGFSFGIKTSPQTSPSIASKSMNAAESPKGLSGNASTGTFTLPTTTPNTGFSFGIKSTPQLSSSIATKNTNATDSPKGLSGNTSTGTFTLPTSTPNTGFSFGIKSTPQLSSSIATKNTNAADSPKGLSGNTSTGTLTLPTSTSNTGFSFGIKSTAQPSIFSNSATTTNGTSSFSFGTGRPFSFNSNVQKKEGDSNDNKEDEDEPPKVEYTPMVEENSVFDKKCKIFVKKDANYIDKGVGTLYIKKIEESGKHQLLVRANTSLGNVLLNLILGSSIPTQRMGKNNVMIVCIPTPDAKPPPTPVLIRVKTAEEADELLETLNKYKK